MLESLRRWMTGDQQPVLGVLDTTADGIIGLNKANQIEICNKAACKLFNLSEEYLKGKLITEVMAGVDQEIFTSSKEDFLYEVLLRRADNTTIPIELTIAKTPVISGVSTICIVRNVLERKKAEMYLAMQHDITRVLTGSLSLEKVIPSILEIMCKSLHLDVGELWKIVDQTHTLRCTSLWHTQNNKAIENFCSLAQTLELKRGEELPGRVWETQKISWVSDVVVEVNFPRAVGASKANLHTEFGFPIFFEGKIIAVFNFFMNRIAPLDEPIIKSLETIANQLGIFIDRENAKKLALESLRSVEALAVEYKKAKEEAESANKIKSDFLATMSHELRTPLNAIIGYSEMMAESANEEGLARYSVNLDKVIYSGQHLLVLINDILDLSKIEADKMDVYLEDVSIASLVKDLDALIRPSLEKNKNTFTVNIKTSVEMMHTDILRVRQSLLNLLANADKFTKEGQITLDVTSHGSVVQFDITDTGIGVSTDQLEKLFQSFSQGDSSTTRKYGGTGLGLYLSRRFCELLGGDITVKSEKGKGATFTIVLPQKSEPGEQKINVSDYKSETGSGAQFQGKTALIISYDPSAYQDVLRDIRKLGFVVTHAKNGREGLKLARKNAPSVIVLDISVTHTLDDVFMDEWQTLSELKSDMVLSKIPLVVMTKDITQESLGFVLGEVEFLNKPIDMKVMIQKVKQLVPDGVPTVLVVDNGPNDREIMTNAVAKAGWKSIEAVNGRDALEKITVQTPSVILLDLMMPEMDGFAMINELQKNEKWRDIPVIIISAKNLSTEERTMLTKYSRGIIQKGASSRQELIDVICEQIK